MLKSITTAVETIEKRSFEELNLCIAELVKRVSGTRKSEKAQVREIVSQDEVTFERG